MSLKLWQSRWGDDYHARNVITEQDIKNREFMWTNILNTMETPKSILEIGAGNGVNIQAISNLYKKFGHELVFDAIEPNDKANDALYELEATRNVWFDRSVPEKIGEKYDLVFTSGVLIHIPQDQLLDFTKKMYQLSNKYILCAEYFRPEPETKPYRGESEALFLRDFGAFWLDNFPLQCVSYGFMWKRLTGIDDITWWLFRKVN